MQTINANQNSSSYDPVWVLLAELPLVVFLSDQDWMDEPGVRFLFQTLRELGMSPESVENTTGMLAEFVKEALAYTRQGRLESSGRIRILCPKKIIDDASSAKTSRPPEPGKKQKQGFPDSRANIIGGWGYFMIERGEDLPPEPSAIPHNYIDLYLYKEGVI
jgi:hypothetical protein